MWFASEQEHPAATMNDHIATPYTMSENHRYGLPTALLSLTCIVLTACSSVKDMSASSVNPVNWITPYKADVIQGNFISKEQVEQLRTGMSRDQVKATLGTPLMASLFHVDRWDYVFTLQRQGVESQSFKYTVFFKNDQLERFSGDTMPSEAEFISKLASRRKFGSVPVLEASEEQLKAAEKSTSSKPTPSVAAPVDLPSNAPRPTYPPLESPKQ